MAEFGEVWKTLPIPGEFDALDACDQARWRGVIEAAYQAGCASANEDIARENDQMRATLATGPGPCVYCNLPREQWSQCQRGFPGCARADDAMLCPHFGAGVNSAMLRDALAGLVAAIEVGDDGQIWLRLEDARQVLAQTEGQAHG